jgi:hypothetical protein
MENCKKLKIKKNWKERAKGRRAWRNLSEKAKPHKTVVVPNDDNDDVHKCVCARGWVGRCGCVHLGRKTVQQFEC